MSLSDSGVSRNQLVTMRFKDIEPTRRSVIQCAPDMMRGREKRTMTATAARKARFFK